MDAILISIGTELTEGRVVDTNKAFLGRELLGHGVKTAQSITVPDDLAAISAALKESLEKNPALIVITGGLGPTFDDITSEAVAAALDSELLLDGTAVKMVIEACGAAKLKPHQEKQAVLPAGSIAIKPVGTAPGFFVKDGSIPIVVLPGVPHEMMKMWKAVMEMPEMGELFKMAKPKLRSLLSFYDTGEPPVARAVDSILGDLRQTVDVSICASRREVTVELSYPSGQRKMIEERLDSLRNLFADSYYSGGGAIEEIIASEMLRRGETLATGESCTGGMLGEVITGVSGSSGFFLGGVIAYDNEVKKSLLKVRGAVLEKVGAVSEPVAQQLAIGARKATGASYGIGITGVAGPSGGTVEKPVGLVFISVSSDRGDVVKRFDFTGPRDNVRQSAVTASLHMLHQKMIADEDCEAGPERA